MYEQEDGRIIEVIPGDRKGDPPKGVIKALKPQESVRKVSHKWKRLTIPRRKENRTHWMNRCMDYCTMKIEFPDKNIRERNCLQLWKRWGEPDGKRKLPKLRQGLRK